MIILGNTQIPAASQKRGFERVVRWALVFALGWGASSVYNNIPALKDNSALYTRAIDHDFAAVREQGREEGASEAVGCP